jgi:iron(III) transport system substrate-binding protein
MIRAQDPKSVASCDRRGLCQFLVGSSVAALLSSYTGNAHGQAASAAVAGLALYAGSDRQQMLEEGAKREGQIVQYGSYFEDKIIRPMFNQFKKKYPYLEMSLLRAEPIDAMRRIQEERQAGRDVFDVLQSSISALDALRQRSLITPYHSPPADELASQFRQKDGYWVALGESILCIGYNTNIVKPSEAPKSYEDLLDPKWRGMIAVPSGSTFTHWMEGLWEIWGEDRARDYFEKLKLNQPRLRAESARALTDLIAGGQIPISPGVLNAHMAMIKRKGAPVDWAAPDPAFSWIQGVALSAKAPHPHASLLWIDWLLTKEGAQALADVGYIPVDPRATTKWPNLNTGNVHVIDELKEQERLPEFTKLRNLIVFG